ncbi:hypothetical protein FD755_010036 [Muntiacus reevesi]|uniref:Vasculin n=1 Tax=Muntiacus reevesi TaxID=9886 RepID=A0A5N3XZ20_MUNRE|nr:hypothetical protein FD755_010036 [Muntiacus reevesi]
MAQHDFAPAWLNFPTPPSSTKSSLNFEKHSENFSWTENHYDVNRGYHGGSSHSRSSIFHSRKSQGLHENNIPDSETGRKEDKREYKQEPNQNKSLAAGVWGLHAQTHTYPTKKISQAPLLEYTLNPKSRTQRMLVIKKVKNGTGPSVYKGLVSKPAALPTKPTQWKSQTKENKVGTSSLMSLHMNFSPSTTSVKECNRSDSSSPVDKLNQQPCLTKLTRMCTDKKSEILKALKRDRVEEEHEDESHVGSEKDDDPFNLPNSNSTHQGRDINRNFDENEIPQENGNASVISQQIIQSSAFPQIDVLSSSLEAEYRLLKEMGWQEDSENDETCVPLTEDERREFQVISEQLQKSGLRKNGILRNGLICDFEFGPWRNSTFKPTVENDGTE